MKTVLAQIAGYPHAEVKEDEINYYIDLKTGLGVSIYPKCDYSIIEAIWQETNFKNE